MLKIRLLLKTFNQFVFAKNLHKPYFNYKKIVYLCSPVFETVSEYIKNTVTMAKKGNRIQVILECTEQKNSGVPGMSRYITTKNRKNTTQRIELKKYNPYMRKVTLHKEIK